jgi:hypothetical protein
LSEVSEATSITTGTRTDGPGGNHFPSEPWDESFTTGRFLTPASQSSESVSYPSSKFCCGKLSQVWPLLWVSSGKFSKLSQVGERLRARAMGNAIWKVCIYIAVKLKLQWRIFFEKKKCFLTVFFSRKLSLQLSFGVSAVSLNSILVASMISGFPLNSNHCFQM